MLIVLGTFSIYVNHGKPEIPNRYLKFTQLPKFEYITDFLNRQYMGILSRYSQVKGEGLIYSVLSCITSRTPWYSVTALPAIPIFPLPKKTLPLNHCQYYDHWNYPNINTLIAKSLTSEALQNAQNYDC